jgi:uncharacterized protein YjbI with pentapeptide repeats
MTESTSQPEKPKPQPRFSQEQYDMLKRCSDMKDMTEWNEWRKAHPAEDIWLQAVNFKGYWLGKANFIGETVWRQADGKDIDFTAKVHLEGAKFESAYLEQAVFAKAHMERSRFQRANAKNADFHSAHLEETRLGVANFENCNFSDAILENAYLTPSELKGAKFTNSDLRGCWIRACIVDGATRFWECKVNRYSRNERFTDLTGTPLDSVIVDPGMKQLLEYNVRRSNWEQWYKFEDRGNWRDSSKERRGFSKAISYLVRFFWWVSDYGISAPRIIRCILDLGNSLCRYLLFLGIDPPAGDSGFFVRRWRRSRSSVVAGSVAGHTFFSCNNDGWVYKYARKCAQLLGPHIGGFPNDPGICFIGCVGDAVCGLVYSRWAGGKIRG